MYWAYRDRYFRFRTNFTFCFTFIYKLIFSASLIIITTCRLCIVIIDLFDDVMRQRHHDISDRCLFTDNVMQ